jgi:hypothetical protein
MLVLVLE